MKPRFSFKHVEKSQKKLIQEWLSQEHIAKWLHGVGLRNLLQNLNRFLEGHSSSTHWIAYDHHIPFAYLLTSPEGTDAISLDLFICELDYLGKGLAVPMIHEFLLSQFPHLKEVFIDPEISNTRAVHVYQKAGFRIVGEFIAEWHPVPHYKMQLEMKDLMDKF